MIFGVLPNTVRPMFYGMTGCFFREGYIQLEKVLDDRSAVKISNVEHG